MKNNMILGIKEDVANITPPAYAARVGDLSIGSYVISSDEFLSNVVLNDSSCSISGNVEVFEKTLAVSNGKLSVIGSIEGGNSDSKALGENSFAFGNFALALSDAACAEGLSAYASGLASFAEGYQTSALGERSHAEGSKTIAEGKKSHAEGGSTKAIGNMSHSEGDSTRALYTGGHAEGKSTTAYMYAHAEGSETLAGYDLTEASAYLQGDIASHAEGYQTSAIARFSHAEGYGTLAGIPDPTTRPIKIINGKEERNFDIDQAAHAEGLHTSALRIASHAAGISAIARNEYSYVWNGKRTTIYDPNKGNGTYCINPNNGISGFWIGDATLHTHISNAISGLPTENELSGKLDKQKGNSILGPDAILAYGNSETKALGKNNIAIGNTSYVSCDIGFAFGQNNIISGKCKNIIAFGESNSLSSTGSSSGIFIGGLSNEVSVAANNASLIYGRSNKLSNSGLALVVGEGLSCNHNWTTLLGKKARTTKEQQFVWSGVNAEYVPNANIGTFNVDPADGIKGFYIGKDNFVQCVLNAISAMTPAQIGQLKNILSVN